MFCAKCGHKLESDDVFCPMCGSRVSDYNVAAPNLGAQAAGIARKTQATFDTARKTVSMNSGKIYKEATDMTGRMILSALGFCILAGSFFPFANIRLGEWGNLAGAVLGRRIGNLRFNLYGLKAAIVGLCKLMKDEGAGNSIDVFNTFITVAVIAVPVVAILAMMSGLINRKGFVMASGIASAACLGMWGAYAVYVGNIAGQINSYLGEYASVRGFFGIGLIMMLAALAAHAFLAILKASKM